MPRAKKTDVIAEEKTAITKKTTRKPCAKVQLFIEHNGVQAGTEEIVKNVKATYAAQGGTADIKTLQIYVKPQENSAYYVVNGEESGKMDIFF